MTSELTKLIASKIPDPDDVEVVIKAIYNEKQAELSESRPIEELKLLTTENVNLKIKIRKLESEIRQLKSYTEDDN